MRNGAFSVVGTEKCKREVLMELSRDSLLEMREEIQSRTILLEKAVVIEMSLVESCGG
jgi:hypothetical protein